MRQLPSLLWNSPLMDLKPRLQDCVDQALGQTRLSLPVRFFFRADDIGVPGKRLFRLLDMFLECQTPLCLAVVPSWLSRQRWDIIQKTDQNAPELWCWHQHGWRHVTHEIQGKKQEFGPVHCRNPAGYCPGPGETGTLDERSVHTCVYSALEPV